MNIEDIKKHEGKLTKVRVERKYPSDIYTNGFVHFVNDEIVIFQQYHDFYCEGYCLLRVSDIIGIRSNKYERFFEKIFKEEGLLSKVSSPNIPQIDSIKGLLEYFKNNESNIIIECEFENEEDDIFACGKISEIEDGTVWVKEFNAVGEWEEKELGVELKSVTRLQFDTPYLNIFSKHIPVITNENT